MPTTKVNIKLTLISNIPFSFVNINNLNAKSKKKSIKNFLYFLCLYSKIFKCEKSVINYYEVKLFNLKKKTQSFTLLRAPFRHKLTKKNYTLIRHKIIFLLLITLTSKIKLSKLHGINFLINVFKDNMYWFETNIQYIQRMDIQVPLLLKKIKL